MGGAGREKVLIHATEFKKSNSAARSYSRARPEYNRSRGCMQRARARGLASEKAGTSIALGMKFPREPSAEQSLSCALSRKQRTISSESYLAPLFAGPSQAARTKTCLASPESRCTLDGGRKKRGGTNRRHPP